MNRGNDIVTAFVGGLFSLGVFFAVLVLFFSLFD
jgi:hypothetical protein